MSKKKDTPRPLPDTLGLPPTGADSHAHLDSEGIIERLPEVMGRARSTGLASIGQVFLGPAAYHANKDTFAGYPGVFFLMGIHPCDGQECTGATLKAMREAVKRIPPDRLMVETDCPYLSPVPWRGKPNEPALVAFTAETVALERGMDPAELWTLCGDNTRRFFNAPAKGL